MSSASWDTRLEAYRTSAGHREGADLDLLVAWCEPAEGRDALDVATGGGHVARRLREAGCRVVTCDASPGMQADVVCRAEELPFADSSFDVAACRIAAHHFDSPARATGEMARVAPLVVLEDTLYEDEAVEEAERLRDPTHVRSYSEDEWRRLFADAGLEVEEVAVLEKRRPVEEWLELTGCTGADAERVRALLGDRIEDGQYVDTKIVLRGRR